LQLRASVTEEQHSAAALFITGPRWILPPKGTPTVSSAACLLRYYAKRDISSVAVAPKVCQTESCSPIKFEIFREKSWLASGGSGLTDCRGSILGIGSDPHP
jgi:hypothetical protein